MLSRAIEPSNDDSGEDGIYRILFHPWLVWQADISRMLGQKARLGYR